MYQNYIFDLYGTLVDIHTDEWKDTLWREFSIVLAAHGAFYQLEELRAAYHSEVQQLKDVLRQTSKFDEPEIDIAPVFRQLLTAKGKTTTDQEIAALAWTFRTLSTEKLRLFDGVKQLLCQLKERGKRIYLLSNAQALFTRPELTMLGLEEYFDGVLLSSEVGVKKPDAHFYHLLLEQYRLRPEQSLMTGNDNLADCYGAAAVGLDSCYIFTEQSPARCHPLPERCREIRHILEILAMP